MTAKDMVAFPKLAKAKPDEVVIFSYVVFESRQHRNATNKKIMADPRIRAMCAGKRSSRLSARCQTTARRFLPKRDFSVDHRSRFDLRPFNFSTTGALVGRARRGARIIPAETVSAQVVLDRARNRGGIIPGACLAGL